MIVVDVIPAQNNIFLVRFSEPNESFKDKVYTPVWGLDEVKRRMYFKNRMYVLNTLNSWLNQRQHASHSYTKECVLLQNWLLEYQNASFFKLCEFIKRKRLVFEDVAPGDQSRYYNHYINTIVPILDFAELEEDNQR